MSAFDPGFWWRSNGNLGSTFINAKNNFYFIQLRFEKNILLESAFQIVYNLYVLNFNKLLNVEKITILIKKK